jgi:phosphoribosylamine--glycine ligase/phosphoribosylformylglycinamidine cyclo-ligase
VSGTDGVGTKLRVALTYGKHSTVGIDLVAMSVNDLIVQGAEPLYFLDYYACSKLDVAVAADVITGIAEGCLDAGCALIGGETAEMPGMYHADDYDLAGFAVGAVERHLLLPRPDITAGDVLLALPASGPHSNGFSLIRKIVTLANLSLDSPAPWDKSSSVTVGDSLLTPTKIYIKPLLPGIRQGLFKGMSHITGGGFTENIPRIFDTSSGLGVKLDLASYDLPAIWRWMMQAGNVAPVELARTFNCGVGMIIVVGKEQAEEALKSLRENGEKEAFVIGEVIAKPGVEYVNMDRWD